MSDLRSEIRLEFSKAAGVHAAALALVTICIWIKNSTAGKLVAIWSLWWLGYCFSELTLYNGVYNGWWFLLKGAGFLSVFILVNAIAAGYKAGPQDRMFLVRPLWHQPALLALFLGAFLFGVSAYSIFPFLDRPGVYSHAETALARATNRMRLKECKASYANAKDDNDVATMNALEGRMQTLQRVEEWYRAGRVVEPADADCHIHHDRDVTPELQAEIDLVMGNTNSITPMSLFKWFWFDPKPR